MDYIEIADYFGHSTEAEFLSWAVRQFKEHTDIEVKDKSEMTYKFEVVEQDGCCEICYTEDVRVEVQHDDTVIIFSGYYSYESVDDADKLVLTSHSAVEVKNL